MLTGGIQPNFVDTDAVLANQSFALTTPWIASLVASPLVWLVVALTTWHRARLRADIGYARRRRARRDAHARANRALHNSDPAAQLHGLAEALTHYLSDRFDLPSSTLTPDEVRSVLATRGVEDGTVTTIVQFLESCDAARFAPGAIGDTLASHAARNVRRWIKRIEGGTR